MGKGAVMVLNTPINTARVYKKSSAFDKNKIFEARLVKPSDFVNNSERI